MNDKWKVNRPYERLGYERSSFERIGYDKVDYSSITYEGSGFAGAEYISGADMKDTLIGKINIKEAKIGVVGLGYVGLPLALEMAEAGFKVSGVDTKKEIVDRLNKADPHVGDVSASRLAKVIEKGMFKATTDYDALFEVDCVSICVPTPLRKTKDPDISYVTAAVDELIPRLKPGKLVVLESTTYPGSTEELIGARIKEEVGFEVGKDVFVAFSPERVDPGNKRWNTKNTPKVIGGLTPACGEVARALYSAVVDKIYMVASAKEAETVKLLENTFRAVNIALVNEFMLMCDRLGIDVWNVIEAAATKPFGFMPFYPGPGIGGHCIPLDPMYLSWKAKAVDFYNRFIELATDINGNMPRFVISKLSDLLNDRQKPLKGSKIMVLGMAYKANVSDLRESPGLEIYRLLRQKGAWVEFSDPHASSFVSMLGNTVNSIPIDGGKLKQVDAAVLVTEHEAFDYKKIAEEAPLVLDCRGAFARRGIASERIVKL